MQIRRSLRNSHVCKGVPSCMLCWLHRDLSFYLLFSFWKQTCIIEPPLQMCEFLKDWLILSIFVCTLSTFIFFTIVVFYVFISLRSGPKGTGRGFGREGERGRGRGRGRREGPANMTRFFSQRPLINNAGFLRKSSNTVLSNNPIKLRGHFKVNVQPQNI